MKSIPSSLQGLMDVDVDLSALKMRAGDTLLVRVHWPLKAGQEQHIHDIVKCRIPPDVHVLVLDTKVDIGVLKDRPAKKRRGPPNVYPIK